MKSCSALFFIFITLATLLSLHYVEQPLKYRSKITGFTLNYIQTQNDTTTRDILLSHQVSQLHIHPLVRKKVNHTIPSRPLNDDTIEKIFSRHLIPRKFISYKPTQNTKQYAFQWYEGVIDKFRGYQSVFHNRTDRPYICYDGSQGGFGNKIRSFLSAMTLSIVTNRTLVVCNWPAFYEYFSIDFPLTILQLNYTNLNDKHIVIYHKQMNLKFKNNYLVYNIMPILKYHGIIIQSMYDYYPLIQSKSNFRRQYYKSINELYGTTKTNYMDYYHYLLTHVVQPSLRIQDQIDSFASVYFENEIMIGLQIRTGILPDIVENDSPFVTFNSKPIIQEAKRIHMELEKRNYSSRIFLVTDNIPLKSQLLSNYTYMIGYNSMVGHSESIAMNQYSQIAADSLIEMNLLSKCKIIVKTNYSTFGEMAKMIGGHRIEYYLFALLL